MERTIPHLFLTLSIALLFPFVGLSQSQTSLGSTSIGLQYGVGLDLNQEFQGSSIGGSYGIVLDHFVKSNIGVTVATVVQALNTPNGDTFSAASNADNWTLLKTRAMAMYAPAKEIPNFRIMLGGSHGLILKEAGFLPGLQYNTFWFESGLAYDIRMKRGLKTTIGILNSLGNIYDERYGYMLSTQLFFGFSLLSSK